MKLGRMIKRALGTVAAVLVATQMVYAMGGSDPTPQKPDFEVGKAAIEKEDWNGAIAAFTKVTAEEPKNADAYNYLGYANRQMKNYEAAFANYEKALALSPEHRGANEYIGEAYLQTGNLAKAEEYLAKLRAICYLGCPEYTMLKRAVDGYKAKQS
ncbi:tetratricopeptide repeat protein [Sneathiella sp.]|uniref:tetratricopeptide repeat protein n=1 Tax=Sneathiella sp. TaxID=1964365 RepID=UPI002FE14928